MFKGKIPDNYSIVDTKKLSGRCALSEEEVERNTFSYACAVVAMTEVAIQTKHLIGGKYDTFDFLWYKSLTKVYKRVIRHNYQGHSEVEIAYGSTFDRMIPVAMKKLSKKTKSELETNSTTKAKFSFFKKAINNKHSATLSYKVKDKDGKTFAHTINVVGYCIAENNNNHKKKYYLIVANGWDHGFKYIEYPGAIYYKYGVEFIFD